jgi:hypothetical protein
MPYLSRSKGKKGKKPKVEVEVEDLGNDWDDDIVQREMFRPSFDENGENGAAKPQPLSQPLSQPPGKYNSKYKIINQL